MLDTLGSTDLIWGLETTRHIHPVKMPQSIFEFSSAQFKVCEFVCTLQQTTVTDQIEPRNADFDSEHQCFPHLKLEHLKLLNVTIPQMF